MTTWRMLRGQAYREWLSVLRGTGDVLSPLVFFVIVATLFPMATGTDPEQLQNIGPGVLWVGLLLATMLALQRLFNTDLGNGLLEQLLISPCPLPLLVLVKVLAHWLATAAPMLLIVPLVGIPYGISPDLYLPLFAGMLLGTPALFLIGSVNAALTVGLRGGSLLTSLLVLPLYVPVLIFGSGAVASVKLGHDPLAHYYILAALLVAALFLAPWAAATALRISLD